jgi:predicted O-methyltransferase YrrM
MFRPGSLTARIYEYERSLPQHRAGTLDAHVLRAIEDLAPTTVNWSMETGCGKSTILLSNLSSRHVVFAYNDREHLNSSIQYYSDCPLFREDTTTLVPGATQLTLPQYAFDRPIDLALLDGPHGYPFPELEYYYVYPHLRPGALLIVDDIHIPTIYRLHQFLLEDAMFELVHIERTTAFFRRTEAPVFSPLGDGWELQAYNQRRFPVDPNAPAPPPAADPSLDGGAAGQALERAKVDLEATRLELEAEREQRQWWMHVADERRLKRRLARRFGEWTFLK